MTYVSQLGEKDLPSKKESYSAPDIDIFAIPSLIFFHLDLLRIESPKLTSRILMKIVTIPVVLVDTFYFYMHQLIKWLFEKLSFSKIFIELVYLDIFI